MKIDITSLRIERTSDECIRIAMKQEKGKYSEYETFFCISKTEWPMVRTCMLGISEVYPYFDDYSYLLKFVPHGMRVAYTGRDECDYFTFPANELVNTIEYSWEDRDFNVNLTSKLEEWQKEYGPNIQVNIDENVLQRMLSDIQSPLLKREGVNLVDDLVGWASNYSNGNLVSVNIQFDSTTDANRFPDQLTSYYWWIWDEEQKVRIVNGGYIAHHYEQDDGSMLFEYSMHT